MLVGTTGTGNFGAGTYFGISSCFCRLGRVSTLFLGLAKF
jgi:hypothetical protein